MGVQAFPAPAVLFGPWCRQEDMEKHASGFIEFFPSRSPRFNPRKTRSCGRQTSSSLASGSLI
jgi:hypothetical protein